MKIRFSVLLAIIFVPLVAHSFDVAIKDGEKLLFEYNEKSYVYDLQASALVAQIDGLISTAVVSQGRVYAMAGFSDTEIYSYVSPIYSKSLYFHHEDAIVGFGFVEQYFIVGFRNGRISVYQRESLQMLFEYSLEGTLSDLVVASTGAVYVVNYVSPTTVLRKLNLAEDASGLSPQAQIPVFDNYVALDAQEKIIKTFTGLVLDSGDLSYIASTEGKVSGAGDFIVTSNQCGYLKHEFTKGKPKTYAAKIEADYHFVDGGDLVELEFQKIINEASYIPSRKSLEAFVEDEPKLHVDPLPIAEIIFPKVSSDETEHLFLSGRDSLGSAIVGIWSVIGQKPVASFTLSCGIRDAAYSYAQEKYYVYDYWGRVYEFDVLTEPKIRYLATAGSFNSYHYLATNTDSLEIRDHARAVFFDYSGDFRNLGAPTSASIEETCNVPSFNRADCHRYADIEHIPEVQRSVVAWVGEQLVTLSEDYVLRFWNALGTVRETYSAPYHRIMTMGRYLLLLRFDADATVMLAVDPLDLPDTDSDGVNDLADNCIEALNQSQVDMDGDGIGNACDEDLDGDFLPNDIELAVGVNPQLSVDGNGDLDGDGFSNLVEYALGSQIDLASSIPLPESSYSESFENGWPRRFFSGGKYPWSLSTIGYDAGVLRGPNGAFFSGESSVFFYIYAEKNLAVRFYVRGRPQVRVGGVASSNVSMSRTLEGGWVMVTVVVGAGVNKIEVVDKAYSSPPIVGASFREYIDNVHAGVDRDLDGIADEFDLCPLTPMDISANGVNLDADGDGMAHQCDPDDDHFDVLFDSDGDGYFTHADNCPDTSNADQLDSDGDLAGDTCDLDDDNDGYSDKLEMLHGSSTTEKEYFLALGQYFPTKQGKFVYKNSSGETQTEEITRLANGQYRSIDEDGVFVQYAIDGTGFYFTAVGDQDGSLGLGAFEYLPFQWQLNPSYVYSSSSSVLSMTNEVRLLDFHIIEYKGQEYPALTFQFTQVFEGEVLVTEETYAKGLGLYKTDDYVLTGVEDPKVATSQPPKSKKKGGAGGTGLAFLLILVWTVRIRGTCKQTNIKHYELPIAARVLSVWLRAICHFPVPRY